MAKAGSNIRNEMKKIEQSFHIKAYYNMRQLSLSLYTFRENYIAFIQHLEAHNDIEDLLSSDILKSQPLRWTYAPMEQKTYQLFLNFVASAKALIDHTRNIVEDLYLEKDFYIEYNNKVSQKLKSVPIRAFIQDLRSYVLHHKFPFVGTQLKLQRISPLGSSENLAVPSIRLTLSKPQLLKWGRWTRPSKDYLETQSDEIFLDTLINEYYLLIDSFYLWLDQRQREMHESEYSWLLDQWEELYQKLGEVMEKNYTEP